jgi:hypothetical protein
MYLCGDFSDSDESEKQWLGQWLVGGVMVQYVVHGWVTSLHSTASVMAGKKEERT